MSKIQKHNTVQLNLQNVQQLTPTNGLQVGNNSPKPPIASKLNKSPKGDISFRIISPKMNINTNNSQRSISKSSSLIEKQISEPDKQQYIENENDAVIEDNQINFSETQQLNRIKEKLLNMGQQISNFHLVDINLKVLKTWQSELLQETKQLISLNKNVNNIQNTKISSPRETTLKKVSSTELLEKLQVEQKKRLDAEEQSSRILQEQEKYISVLVTYCIVIFKFLLYKLLLYFNLIRNFISQFFQELYNNYYILLNQNWQNLQQISQPLQLYQNQKLFQLEQQYSKRKPK